MIDPMILVVGESIVDVVARPDGTRAEHAGGSPANVAVGLGRLGLEVTLATTIGDDEHGTLLRGHLAAAGVHLQPGLSVPERSARALATLDDEGGATYSFDITWDPGRIWAESMPEITHTGSIAAFLQPGADDVEDLLRRLAPTSIVTFDPNIRPDLLPDHAAAVERTETCVQLADLVKVSDEDLWWLHPDEDPADAARRWLRSGPAAVIVTLGRRGARTFTAHGSVSVPASAESVVDTVGAGDAFMSGIIAALHDEGLLGLTGSAELRDADLNLWRRVTAVAARSSAIVVSRAGAEPPWREELFGPAPPR